MARNLTPELFDQLDKLFVSIQEQLKKIGDSSNPSLMNLGHKLVDIQYGYTKQEFDAETYVNKLGEFVGIELNSETKAGLRGVMCEDYLRIKNQRNSLCHTFKGQPAHPEHFDIWVKDGDRFAGEEGFTQGVFKYRCPKIGGQKFTFVYRSDRRKDNGDYWIELRDNSAMGKLNAFANLVGTGNPDYNQFELRLIQGGNLYSMSSTGVLLEGLVSLATDEEYELAFAGGYVNSDGDFVAVDTKPLSKEEISIFKSYIRAFIEALEGKGKYSQDLQTQIAQQPQDASSSKKGCLGILFLPILALGGILLCVI